MLNELERGDQKIDVESVSETKSVLIVEDDEDIAADILERAMEVLRDK